MIRHFLLSALFSFTAFFAIGQGYQVQSKYFVYLQTEPAQPFYIKINGQKIEANASGYLILPQLKDGEYKLVVGFPQSKIEEQVFNFKIDSKDKGYLIKDYGSDGWGLFDLQTMAVQKSIKGGANEAIAAVKPTAPKIEPAKEASPKEDVTDFTKVLSKAANDPSLLEKPKPTEIEKPVVQAPPVEQNKPQTITKPANENPVVNNQKPTVPSSSGKEVRLIYDDRNEYGQPDPVTIFIPAPKESKTKQQPVKKEVIDESTQNVIAKEEPVVALSEKVPVKKEETKVVEKVIPKTTNAACKTVADEDDFLKLRRSMASQTNDDSMIEQAKKAFISKCYTTAQIKYLSSMFLSNAGKYNFYAAAQSHIADRENFASLATEIKDDNYRDKFNTLLR